MGNEKLHKAKRQKNDEFYTRFEDIQKELKYYKHHFEGKTVFLNCDDPYKFSNFFQFFSLKFKEWGLERLIATHYEKDGPSYKHEIIKGRNDDGLMVDVKPIETRLKGNGDFRSPECLEILKEADIICTNPPFSLFREYIDTLITYNKKFLIIGNMNAITYKNVFRYIKENELWLGINYSNMKFRIPEDSVNMFKEVKTDETGHPFISMGNTCWFTNLDHHKRHEKIETLHKYDPEKYPTYDNYPAIEVSKVAEIPYDYYGEMGVPITYLFKHNPDQFEIVDLDIYLVENLTGKRRRFMLNGKTKYARLVIKQKHLKKEEA